MYYAGIRYSKDSKGPEELLQENGYLTSSKTIKNIIKEDGLENFIIRKIKLFDSAKDVLEYESKFLQRVDAKNNKNFYNKHNNEFVPCDYDLSSEKYTTWLKTTYGEDIKNFSQTDEWKKIVPDKLKKPKTEEQKKRMRKPKSEEGRLAIKNSRIKEAESRPEYYKNRGFLLGSSGKGIPKSEDHRKKITSANRKKYKFGDIIVTNAKEFCEKNNYSYKNFTQCAKHGLLFNNSIKITRID